MSEFSGNSLGRLEAMQAIISPSVTTESVLDVVNANLELLYIKAKNYHWNVKGVGFKGVHEIFDDLHEYAEEQADRVAERLRHKGRPVNASMSEFLKKAWFPEGNYTLPQTGMLRDMVETLETISGKLKDYMSAISDETTINILQDISEGIDRHCYFVKSSLPTEPLNDRYA